MRDLLFMRSLRVGQGRPSRRAAAWCPTAGESRSGSWLTRNRSRLWIRWKKLPFRGASLVKKRVLNLPQLFRRSNVNPVRISQVHWEASTLSQFVLMFFFSFGSSGYQYGSTVAALSVQWLVEHAKNILQNNTTEWTPHSVEKRSVTYIVAFILLP